MSDKRPAYTGKGAKLMRRERPKRLDCPIHGPACLHMKLDSLNRWICRECVRGGNHSEEVVKECKRLYHHYYYYTLHPNIYDDDKGAAHG
jgi:hypothetical protein